MRIFTRERLIALGLFFVFLFGMTQFSRKMHYAVGMGTCIWSDGIGYYEYLPALFIRHDVNHIGWGMPLPNGNRFDKYATGVAILETPFFLAADAATVLNHRERTGFSSYYGYGVLFADLFYTFAGFIFLFYTLRKWFSLRTVFFSIILIALGTNLFYYGFAEPSMSHAYSFFAFAGFLFYCRKFHEEGRRSRHLHAVGFFLGLATAIRPTSIVIGIFFLLYGVYSGKDFRERLKTFFSDRRIIPALLFWGVLLFLPQMLYWHSTTGKWFTYSYGYYDEGFTYWKSPHFFDVLFGPWCSWIPYTPVMIFFFPGLIYLLLKRRLHSWAILSTFAAILYLCASWWAYRFDCAFGYRSFVEYYPLFIIPVAALIEKLLKPGSAWWKPTLFFLLATFFIYVNMRLCLGPAQLTWCSKEYFWPDYWKMMQTIYTF